MKNRRETKIGLGAAINAENKEKNTPLHIACIRGHTECARRLVAVGGNLNACNAKGFTPFHLAIQHSNDELIKNPSLVCASLVLLSFFFSSLFVCLFVCFVCLFGLVWFGVVWCGVVWCGVVWCGVVWCGVVVMILSFASI